MTVAVMIATRNRVADLAVTLMNLARLSPPPDEILVTLDGCTDGSAELLRDRHPRVRVLANSKPGGSIPARDRMLRLATSDLVLSLDDDSYPLEPAFLRRATDLFATTPSLAVLCFPQRTDEFPTSLEQKDFGPDTRVGSYASSGVMIRRSTYLSLPGYAVIFSHMYEEPDYALQCIAEGLEVRRHCGLSIRHHYSSANRNEIRIHHLHARNEAWSILMRCPSPWWPLMLLRRVAGQCAYACRRGPAWVWREPLWWWAAMTGAPRAWRQRRPVAWRDYRRWLHLLRSPEPLAGT